MMFYQKNFLIVSEVMFISGLASIHFVKYSTATAAYFTCPELLVEVPLGQFPIFKEARTEVSAELAPKVLRTSDPSFDMLGMFSLCAEHPSAPLARRIF